LSHSTEFFGQSSQDTGQSKVIWDDGKKSLDAVSKPVNLKPFRGIKALSPVRLPPILNLGLDILAEKFLPPTKYFRNFVAFSSNT